MGRLIICTDCERERPNCARGRCRTCYRKRKYQENREQERQRASEWKRLNREHVRAYSREYMMRGQCSVCRGPMYRAGKSGVCRTCQLRAITLRRERIYELWAKGLSRAAIAKQLGWTSNHLGVEIVRMRAEGWDLPYRYAMRDGKRVPA